MISDTDNAVLLLDPLDPDLVYRNYLETCAMLNDGPVPRERALGFMQKWNEVLSGRPEPRLQ